MYSPDGSAKWAFWHRSQRHAGGVESTLRFNSSEADLTTDWAAANENFIYASGLPKQGLRGFARPTGAWLFWHSGPPGREQLMYRWDFNGVTVNSNEAPVPVTNVAPAGQLSDLVNATLTDGTKAVIQRPSVGPFTYTKDVSVVPYNGAVNVFFSGFVTAEAQADICWSRFNLASMGPTSAVDNFAKLPFASITNWEEMQPDALRQKFGSRHLDWLVNRDFAATGPGPATGLNPRFILQLGFDSNVPPRPQRCFLVDWAEAPTAYDRARGVYRVRPILSGLNGAVLPARFAIDVTSNSWYIKDPHSSTANPQPLMMDVNIAAGTVQFASPLFNEDAPTDPTAAFNSSYRYDDTSGPVLNDVALRVNYTPYLYRVTRSEAQDDSPSAFYDPGVAQRLTVFWRRSYPTGEAPHFGRAAFMYRVFTTSVQVARPAVALGARSPTPSAALPSRRWRPTTRRGWPTLASPMSAATSTSPTSTTGRTTRSATR